MKPSNAIQAVMTLVAAGQVPYLEGAPGIGKTSIIDQSADALPAYARAIPAAERDVFLDLCAAPGAKVSVKVSRLALNAPEDLKGLPDFDRAKKLTVWYTPSDFPSASDGPVLWFFDEWAQGLPSVQNAAGQILNEHRIGDYVLPPNVRIVAAGNRAKDRAGVNKIPTQVADRMFFIPVDFDVVDFIKRMIAVGAPTPIPAFASFKPDLICAFDPNAKSSPTPRSVEKCGEILKRRPPAAIEHDLYAGKCGEGWAVEFTAFLRVWRELTNVDAAIMNPDTAKVPDLASAKYAMAGALAHRATEDNFDRVLRYGVRLGDDISVALVRQAIARTPAVQTTRAFIAWAADHAEINL